MSTAESLEERVAAHFSQETDVSESKEQEQPSETEAEEPTEESAADEEASVQFEEVEFDGEKYQIPPALKEAFMAKSDYTAKTTETARLKEALTLQQQEVALFSEQRAFEQSVAGEVDQLKMLDAYIHHTKTNTNWSELSTDQIVRARLEIDQLVEQREELNRSLGGKREEFKKKLGEERNKLKQSANEALVKAIPGWNDELRGEVEKSLLTLGYPEMAVNNMTALDYQVAWEASQYRKLKEGKAAALKNAATTPPVVRTGPSNPMPKDVKDKLSFKKQLDKAKSDKLPEGQQAKIVQARIEQKFRRFN